MASRRAPTRGGLAGRLRSLSPRDRRALFLGLAIVGPAILWMGVVRPWWGNLAELRDVAAMERDLLARERQLLLEAPGLPARLAEARTALARKEATLVQSTNLALAEAVVTSIVQERARESRALLLEARSMAPDPRAAIPDGLVPIRLNVRVESDFEGLLDFMHALEADPLLVKVIAFSMEPAQGGAMTLSAMLEAYALEAPTVESPAEGGTGSGSGEVVPTRGEDVT